MFSIAPQSVTLPGGGPTLVFASGDPDTSKVTLTVAGRDANGNDGTHVFTFNRNGALQGDPVFTPNHKPVETPFVNPLAGFKSMDDDAVRTTPVAPPKPELPANKQPIPAEVSPAPPSKTVTSKTLDQDGPAI